MSAQDTARCFYTAMRTEINQHLLIISQVHTIYLGGATALFVAAFQSPANSNLLLLLPMLSFGAAKMLGVHERVIEHIAAYCSEELGKVFKANGEDIPQWDNSKMLKKLKLDHNASNLLGSSALIVLPAVIALLTSAFLRPVISNGGDAAVQGKLDLLYWVGWSSGWLLVLCALAIVIKTARYRKKVGLRNNHISPMLQSDSKFITSLQTLIYLQVKTKR
jgi:hypothetical protein